MSACNDFTMLALIKSDDKGYIHSNVEGYVTKLLNLICAYYYSLTDYFAAF